MDAPEVSEPILNSPFTEPAEHWHIVRGEPPEDALAHWSSERASSSAARISVVEVAPGSWWPMLRSPR